MSLRHYGKMLKIVMFNRSLSVVESRGGLSNRHYEFRKARSTHWFVITPSNLLMAWLETAELILTGRKDTLYHQARKSNYPRVRTRETEDESLWLLLLR